MAHYVIGDIHGCFDEFSLLLSYIENQDNDATILLLGDIIDRGPKVIEMLNWAMEHISPTGRYRMIMGNHELEAIDWFHYHFIPWYESLDFNRKMPDTQYDFSSVIFRNGLLYPHLLKPIIHFFESLPYYMNLEIDSEYHYTARLAHAWYPDKNYIPDCNEEDYVWSREHIDKEFEDLTNENAILIHGHTPTMDRHCKLNGSIGGDIWFKKNSINLDCGCCYKKYHGRLAALCLETFSEYYCDGVSVTEKNNPSEGKDSMKKRFSKI